MLELPKLFKINSLSQMIMNKRKYSFAIPRLDSQRNIYTLDPYYEKVNDLVNGFDKNNITDYDMYLINDVLGIPNTRHHNAQELYEE